MSDFATDGSFVPSPAQAAHADQQFAAVNAILDGLATEARHSAELGLSGTELAVAIGLLCADEVPKLAPTEADELGALIALVGAAVVRLAALSAPSEPVQDKPSTNPPIGHVEVRVEATPHDLGANGHHYSWGVYPAAAAADELRDLADRIEREWTDPACPWPGEHRDVTEVVEPDGD